MDLAVGSNIHSFSRKKWALTRRKKNNTEVTTNESGIPLGMVRRRFPREGEEATGHLTGEAKGRVACEPASPSQMCRAQAPGAHRQHASERTGAFYSKLHLAKVRTIFSQMCLSGFISHGRTSSW